MTNKSKRSQSSVTIACDERYYQSMSDATYYYEQEISLTMFSWDFRRRSYYFSLTMMTTLGQANFAAFLSTNAKSHSEEWLFYLFILHGQAMRTIRSGAVNQ